MTTRKNNRKKRQRRHPPYRKKNLESIYADFFLNKRGIDPENVLVGEKPDFAFFDNGLIGLELTHYSEDEGSKGSRAKEIEAHGANFLDDLARAYYSSQRKPIQLKMRAGLSDLNLYARLRGNIQSLVEAIEKARPSTNGDTTKVISEQVTLHITSLPDEFAGFCRWVDLDSSIGWLREVDISVLKRIIQHKTKLLQTYRTKFFPNILLIVADRTKKSGKYKFTMPATLFNGRGFSEVYLVLFPIDIIKIA